MIKELFVEVRFTDALKKVLLISLLTGLYATLLYYIINKTGFHFNMHWYQTFESIFGFVLGLLLVFRTNKAYERWWEARSLWGTLVNVSINLAIKIKVMLKPNNYESKRFINLITHFGPALAIHLRKEPSKEELKELLHYEELPPHVPSHIAKHLYRAIYEHRAKLTDTEKLIIDNDLRYFMIVSGGSEKIRNTLVSVSYRMFVKHVMILFILVMPCGLINTIGMGAIPITMATAYFMLALEGIARHLEEPFGRSEDHVNLCAVTAHIEKTVSDILEPNVTSRLAQA